ncbi:flavin reductase family protein [Streptomyces sp. NPDC012888]|uniref:flavin reductase family protein n=1 Tax=Streptomyces sp. NPDC012888 TaxID=3364855 RepID=UPI00367567CF
MSQQIPAQLWKHLTSTIGLVSVRHAHGVNVMSAEWTYFVNKEPLYVAVVLSGRSDSRALLAESGEFSVTLCAEEQAELADFAGSFSLSEIDKTSSELVAFGEPAATGTPWVSGGLVSMECALRHTLDLPVHRMYVGEVVAVHEAGSGHRPLVKHGPMHSLGAPVRRSAVVAAAEVQDDGTLRVAATGPAAEGEDLWRLSLEAPDGTSVDLGAHPSGEYGDFLVDLPLPAALPEGARLRVDRDGAKPGYARLLRRAGR